MDNAVEKVNKLSLPAAILVGSIIIGGFYYASQINKQTSIEKQESLEIEQSAQVKKAAEEKERENRILVAACLGSAQESYSKNWASNCKANSRSVLTGYQGCLDRGLSAANCQGVWGTADASADCSLPLSLAEVLNENLQKTKEECFKRYPQ